MNCLLLVKKHVERFNRTPSVIRKDSSLHPAARKTVIQFSLQCGCTNEQFVKGASFGLKTKCTSAINIKLVKLYSLRCRSLKHWQAKNHVSVWVRPEAWLAWQVALKRAFEGPKKDRRSRFYRQQGHQGRSYKTDCRSNGFHAAVFSSFSLTAPRKHMLAKQKPCTCHCSAPVPHNS